MTSRFSVPLLYSSAVISVVILAPFHIALGQVGGTDDNPQSDSGGAATAVSVEALRAEVDRLRQVVERQQAALVELERRLDARDAATHPDATTSASAAEAAPAKARVDAPSPAALDDLVKRWGRFRLAGDLQLRSETLVHQGFDGSETDARNRFRLRGRLQLTGEINSHFDWGLRVATGSFDNPVSPQQTFTDYFARQPIALDRAYLRFSSNTNPVALDLVAGKFDPPWKRTGLTLDPDVQPEGFAERLTVNGRGTLHSVAFVAWQLPYRERAIGADAVLYGGQISTEWKLSDRWRASLSGSFYDFEQVDLIPPVLGASSTAVNAGFDYGTTNAVVVNPATGVPEYRSEYRVVDTIAEFNFAGVTPRWPVDVRADWIHNTSAFNSQKDGGQVEVNVGRLHEPGDWGVEYIYWKAEREAFPSVFMESEFVIPTNAVTHATRVSYVIQKQVQFDVRYLLHRRLETTALVNRWLQHIQFNLLYRF